MSQPLLYDELEKSLAAIVHPKSVFELRLLHAGKRRVDGGYFDSIADAATALSGLREPYKGIYITPNPVLPDLLHRSYNRITPYAEFATDDPSVLRRSWLLIDLDPKRPSNISSTNLEHSRAILKAREIAGMLALQYGWCDPMLNSSGNGAHLLYPINEANDADTKIAIQLFLRSLAYRFNGDGIEVDTGMFNASRIWRLPGTYARKGDNTSERPHRKAEILQREDEFGIVTLAQIREFTNDNSVPTGSPTQIKKVPTNTGLFKRLNDTAMGRLDEWVPRYFPGARPYIGGYRISSTELGRDREEDLTVHPYPKGILDFGEYDSGEIKEGRRTPVEIIAEFHQGGDIKAAADALSATLGVPVSEFDTLELPKQERLVGDFDASFALSGIRSYNSLATKVFKPLKWIIKDVLPAGCFLLAARPKMRKTWLALQLCCAVVTGGKFLTWQCKKGGALILALEDNERRIKSRIETLHTFDAKLPDLSELYYFTENQWPRGQEGCDAIEKFLDEHPNVNLVVIDTLAHFKEKSNNKDVYDKDYTAMMPLTRMAAKRQICLIVVTHEKKGLAGNDSADFLEDVTGSAGISGGTDGVISIKGRRGVQSENESRQLLLSGRDVPHDFAVDISFDASLGGWLVAERQDLRNAITALLIQNPFMTQSEVFAMLPNEKQGRLRQVLMDMKFKGEIEQTKYGYRLKQ